MKWNMETLIQLIIIVACIARAWWSSRDSLWVRKITPKELKQHDEEYRIRKQYWHLLVFVDQMRDLEASDDMHWTDIERIRRRIDGYDLSSTCDLPNHVCSCLGAGIRLR
jgi:hypothetical protein